jgi:TonB family protein
MKIPPTNGITSTPADDQQQDGSLRVFENGKEVFRLPAEVPANARAENPAGRNGVQRASSVEAITPQAAGSVLERVEPQYPEQARQQKIQGPVVLEVHIGRDGAVEEVKLVSGQPVLADAAMAAVKQWRFKPRVEQGKAVEMQTMVTLNFRLPS